ncbi:MAG: nucleoside 2-deoxyribosyltransferase [Thermodesulfobacteriota bacterium]
MLTTDHQDRHRQRVYLAAPLFSEAERTFNICVAELLEELTEVYLPQRDGGLMSEMVATGVQSVIAARHVFRQDMDAIKQADYVIAILDGRAIDEGVAFELGVGFSQAKRCVGLQTDSRRLAVWGNNPMITGSLETVFMSVDDLMEWAQSVPRSWRIGSRHTKTGS